MSVGIVIHISAGDEKRTEIFSEPRLTIGSDESCDLEVRTPKIETTGVWLKLENSDDIYRILDFDEAIGLTVNYLPIRRYIAISDGDTINVGETGISFTFYSIARKPSLISTRRADARIAPFISEAALDAAATPERDDAKAFLREFSRELMREISWTTKAIALVLTIGFLSGILYIGYSVNSEIKQNSDVVQQQKEVIEKLQNELGLTSENIAELNQRNKELLRTASLTPTVRMDYGNAICLIVGVYDLVDRSNGKVLRYPDPQSYDSFPYEPADEGDAPMMPNITARLTTDGNGSPVEYDFIGTGFHVGGGYIVTNRHVLQPWTEDDVVKAMMKESNGRARVKRLYIYFPNVAEPFNLKLRQVDNREDLAVATIDPENLPEGLPIIPLDSDTQAQTVGKTVVTMGYPNGPDRLLAMVDDDEAKSLNRRFGNSRLNLINFLAQSLKIVPLTTQGTITDLDSRRIVHDARTAEGGSGAPLFGQSAKVIGVNFGVFTENTAVNMAVPIGYAIKLLEKAGWVNPETSVETSHQAQTSPPNTNTTASVSAR